MDRQPKSLRRMHYLSFGFFLSVLLFAFLFAACYDRFTVQAASRSTNVPLLESISSVVTESDGGATLTSSFRVANYTATAGRVWVPEERIVCNVPLVQSASGSPSGVLNESALKFDVNGDGDVNDVFIVNYVDNSTAEINGTIAIAQMPPDRRVTYSTPEGYGIYYLSDKTSFQLGSKTHTLHKITYPTSTGIGYAEFGLDCTFRDYGSPCIQIILEQLRASINDQVSAEVVDMRYNGASLPVVSTQAEASPHDPTGQWLVGKEYIYSLGALQNDTVFTIEVSVRGTPGTYLLLSVFNWSPDGVSRYKYQNSDALTLKGKASQNVPFGNVTYPLEFFTNGTAPQGFSYDWRGKEVRFNIVGLGTLRYFWNVTVPRGLLRGPWSVNVAGSPVSFIESSNDTDASVYFSLDATGLPPDFFSDLVSIKGTWSLSDTFPPQASSLQRNPSGTVGSMQPVTISVNATDAESNVANVTLSYSIDNGSVWSSEVMTLNSATNLYEAIVSGQQVGTQVNLRILVFDSDENSVTLESAYAVGLTTLEPTIGPTSAGPSSAPTGTTPTNSPNGTGTGVETATWAPLPQSAVVAATVCVSVTAVISTLAFALTNSASQSGSSLSGKIHNFLPNVIKKWLADSVSSKFKVQIKPRVGSRFVLTKVEIVSYAVTLAILSLGFAYSKSVSLSQILESIPLILATSIFTDLVRNYSVTSISRHMGVWTEHRVWYLGLVLFSFSTIVFKVPFSSPSRLANYSPKMTKRINGLLSSISVVITFLFSFIFLVLYMAGFTLIGNVGLIMCLTGVLFEVLPIAPMGGKGIFDWNKLVWSALFTISVTSYIASLLIF